MRLNVYRIQEAEEVVASRSWLTAYSSSSMLRCLFRALLGFRLTKIASLTCYSPAESLQFLVLLQHIVEKTNTYEEVGGYDLGEFLGPLQATNKGVTIFAFTKQHLMFANQKSALKDLHAENEK